MRTSGSVSGLLGKRGDKEHIRLRDGNKSAV